MVNDELALARFQKGGQADKFKPRDALLAAITAIDEGRLNISHVVVCYAADDGEGDPNGITGFFQAGAIGSYFGSMGLLARVMQVIGGKI